MSIYLSIDLDFWNQGKRSFYHCRQFLETVRKTVPEDRRIIVDSHEDILPHVNLSECNKLINVDWHSDIVNINDPVVTMWKNWQQFNCGTWINFVDFQRNGKYTWIHPHKIGPNRVHGRCHRPYHKNHNPFYSKWTDWKELQEVSNKFTENIIEWDNVTYCGICFSYKWVREELQHDIYKIAKDIFGYVPDENPNALLGY